MSKHATILFSKTIDQMRNVFAKSKFKLNPKYSSKSDFNFWNIGWEKTFA
jgi:hypothetical protein